MDERAFDFVLLPLAGRNLSKWRIHCWVLHPDPEGALRGPVPLQQVPHLRSREDGDGGSAQQAGRGELQRPLQDWALRWVLVTFNGPNNRAPFRVTITGSNNLCSLAHHIKLLFCTVCCHDQTGLPTLMSDIWVRLSHVLIVLGIKNSREVSRWIKGLNRWTVNSKIKNPS